MQNHKENKIRTETVGPAKDNYFLIRLPSNATEDNIKQVVTSSPLQLDSPVFGFITNRSTLCFHNYKISVQEL